MQPSPAKFSARAIKASLWLGTGSLAFTLFIKITSELLEHEVRAKRPDQQKRLESMRSLKIMSGAAVQLEMDSQLSASSSLAILGESGVEKYYLVNIKLFTLRFSPIVSFLSPIYPFESETRQCSVGKTLFPPLLGHV